MLANYITESYDKAAFMTASRLGKTVGVSETTVVRFAMELGYDGYPSMQKAMQDMVLNLTDRGLDTCWVTFTDSDAVKEALGIESDLDVVAMAAFGYGAKVLKRMRLNIRSMSDVDIRAQRQYFEPKKSIYDLAFLDTWGNTRNLDSVMGFYDDILWEALRAASQAPSYLNRQAYGFLIHGGQVSLVSRPDEYTTEIDGKLSLGIVLLHFSKVAEEWGSKISWRFGEEAARPELPEGHRVVATCQL